MHITEYVVYRFLWNSSKHVHNLDVNFNHCCSICVLIRMTTTLTRSRKKTWNFEELALGSSCSSSRCQSMVDSRIAAAAATSRIFGHSAYTVTPSQIQLGATVISVSYTQWSIDCSRTNELISLMAVLVSAHAVVYNWFECQWNRLNKSVTTQFIQCKINYILYSSPWSSH